MAVRQQIHTRSECRAERRLATVLPTPVSRQPVDAARILRPRLIAESGDDNKTLRFRSDTRSVQGPVLDCGRVVVVLRWDYVVCGCAEDVLLLMTTVRK